MDEKELKQRFYQFLEHDKKYPLSSLLKQASAYILNGQKVQVDLILLDVRIGEYIGLVEFTEQITPSIKQRKQHQIQLYLKALKSEQLPFYLVYPISEDNFQILVFGESDWESISVSEFPEFETLSAKKKIEEKELKKDIEEKIEERLQEKKELKSKQSLWTLSSLVLGIAGAILSFYISTNLDFKTKEIDKEQLLLIQKEIRKLDLKSNQILLIQDSLKKTNGNLEVKNLNSRLKIIEDGLLNNPQKVLEISAINQEIAMLKQQIENQNELINLRNENLVTRIEWLNALVIGLILALVSVAIGSVLTSRQEIKNNR